MPDSLSPAAAGFGLGIALAGAPGPVQAVLMGEAIRGGVSRGFRAMAGAAVTFASLLALLALGLSVATPSGPVLRGLKIAGGLLLLWLAIDGFRTAGRVGNDTGSIGRRDLPPAARGVLAILLNPGAWLFLAAVASPLFAEATRSAGRPGALLAAAALVIGLAMGDGTVVLIGGLGVRRAGEGTERWVARGLAVVLAALGAWLLIGGVR